MKMNWGVFSGFSQLYFLGLSLAAPIGPINAAQLDKGIKSGFWVLPYRLWYLLRHSSC